MQEFSVVLRSVHFCSHYLSLVLFTLLTLSQVGLLVAEEQEDVTVEQEVDTEDEETLDYRSAEEFTDADFGPGRDPFGTDQILKQIVRTTAKDLDQRLNAIDRLGEIGPEARRAIPKLFELLSDQTPVGAGTLNTVSTMSSRALEKIGDEVVAEMIERYPKLLGVAAQSSRFIIRKLGPKVQELLPCLVKQFGAERNEFERCDLLASISAVDPTGDTAFPVLIHALRNDGSKYLREHAATWLTRSEFLLGVYWEERAVAAQWIQRSPDKTLIAAEALLAALGDKAPAVRGAAALSLSTYPEVNNRAVPALLKLLEDHDECWRATSFHSGFNAPVSDVAYDALLRMPMQSKRVLAEQMLPKLSEKETDPNPQKRQRFFELLPYSQQPLIHLTPLVNREDLEHKLIALIRLGKIALPAISKVEALAKVNDSRASHLAHLTLACLDPKGHPASVQAVKQLLPQHRDFVRHFLLRVGGKNDFAAAFLKENFLTNFDVSVNKNDFPLLIAVGPGAAFLTPNLIVLSGEAVSYDDSKIIEVLVGIGPPTVPYLIEILRTEDALPQISFKCLRVLGRLKDHATGAVPAIIEQFQSQYPRVREEAATVVGLIASRPDDSLPALQKLMSDPRPFVRAAAIRSCGGFGPAAGPLVPLLIQQLSDDYLDVRIAAASTLGRLGTVAKAAVPKLEELKVTDNGLFRRAVGEALIAIQRR